MLEEQLKLRALAFAQDISQMVQKDIINSILEQMSDIGADPSRTISSAPVKPKRGPVKPKRGPVKPKRGPVKPKRVPVKRRRKSTRADGLTKGQQQVFDQIKGYLAKPQSTRFLSDTLGLSKSSALYHLKGLVAAKVIKRMKEGHSVYFQLR